MAEYTDVYAYEHHNQRIESGHTPRTFLLSDKNRAKERPQKCGFFRASMVAIHIIKKRSALPNKMICSVRRDVYGKAA